MKIVQTLMASLSMACLTTFATAQCPYTVTLQIKDALCNGTATGSATATVNGGTGPFSFSWNTTPVQNGSGITNVPAGSYTLIVKDANGCQTSKLFTIKQPVSLTVSVPNPEAHCQGSIFPVKSVVSGGTQPYQYLWGCISGNCGISNTAAIIPNIQTGVSGVYFLQITDSNGCGASDFFEVNVKANPVVTVSNDVTIYLGEETQLHASANTAGAYLWNPALTLSQADIAEPIATPGSNTTYIVTFTNKQGCRDTGAVTVFVNTDLVIPTGLTPNGDNVNDKWDAKGLTMYPDRKTEVYNRRGDRVFLGHGAQDQWDGTFKGKKLPAGTYYFMITPKDGSDIIKGYLTLIR